MKLLEEYLSFTWSKQHLAKLIAIINLQDGVSAVSAVIVAHIADSCVGRFNMILISTLTYITVSLCLAYIMYLVRLRVNLVIDFTNVSV